MSSMNQFMKNFYTGGDPRSNRGTLARGRNVYKGGSASAKTGSLKEAARKRLGIK
jgi:hypothetical protein